MTTPALAASRFAAACLLGLGLGLWYEFLRPLRPRHTNLSDLLFLPGAFWAWLYLSFGVCGGDLRLGYCAGLFVGAWVFRLLPGRLLARWASSVLASSAPRKRAAPAPTVMGAAVPRAM